MSNLESLLLTIDVPEDADTEEVAKAVSELIRSLNAYHIALGGFGFDVKFED